MSAPPSRVRARLARVLVAIGALTLVVIAGSPAATQQAESRIDLVAQTTFVTAEPVVFDLRITGDLTDRRLNVRVFEPVNDHEALAQLWLDPPSASGGG